MRLDVWNCVLGVVTCTSLVALSMNIYGWHPLGIVGWAIISAIAMFLFARSWTKRGIFRGLRVAASDPGVE